MSNDPMDKIADQLNELSEGVESSSVSSGGRIGGGGGVKDRNLDLILDIPLKVTVELGRTKMPVSELLNLTQGSVIELSKLAGEPMEVLVNDKLIARGEAVVVFANRDLCWQFANELRDAVLV